jgi:hypothetical protein
VRRALLAVLLFLGLAVPARAQLNPGDCLGFTLEQGGVIVGCADYLNCITGDLSCTLSGTVVTVQAGGNLVKQSDGSIGESGDFKNSAGGGVDLGGTLLRLPVGTAPTSTDGDSSGEEGRVYVDSDGPPGARLDIATGASPGGWEHQAGRLHLLGGTGVDGPFSFDGSCSSDGAGGSACCEGGTTSGVAPNKICTLTANSLNPRYQGDSGTTLYSCEYDYTTCALTGGTVTCNSSTAYAATGAPNYGSLLTIRCQGSFQPTGGTIDMSGRGFAAGAGGTSGGTGTNRAGGAGGIGWFFNGGALGAAGKNNGSAGNSSPSNVRLRPMFATLPVGTGGGGGAGSGSAGAAGSGFITGLVGAGMTNQSVGTGGGGGGCNSSVASGTGGDGGRGGGGIKIETASAWGCTGATLTVAGSAGASGKAGGAGGAAGGVEVDARDLGTDTCTYTTTGGNAASPSDSTNCGTSGAGGAGYSRVQRAPF